MVCSFLLLEFRFRHFRGLTVQYEQKVVFVGACIIEPASPYILEFRCILQDFGPPQAD
jgi:hypothetical protein